MVLGDLRSVGLGLLVVGCMEEAGPDGYIPDDPTPLDCVGEDCASVTFAAECPPEGWCWARGWPLEVGGGSTEASVFAIGPQGAFLRWDVDRWVSRPVPTTLSLISAAIGPDGDAWAVDAAGAAWHLRGERWQQVSAGAPLHRIVRIVGSTVYAVSGGSAVHGTASGGVLLQSDGGAWKEAAVGPSYCAGGDYWVLESREIWSAGLVCGDDLGVEALEIRRLDGTSWVLVGDPIPDVSWFPSFYEYDGRVRVDARPEFEWDGQEWQRVTPVPSPQRSVELKRVHAQRGQPVVVVPYSLGCNKAFRIGERAWCFGDAQIFLVDGEAWRPTLRDAFRETQADEAWGTIPPALWAGSDTSRAWGSGPDNVFRIRESAAKVEHYDGHGWRVLDDDVAIAIDGFAADDVWFGTASGLAHFDGETFTRIPPPAGVEDPAVTVVHALDAGVVAAVVGEDHLYRYDGEWSVLFAPTGDVRWTIENVASTSPGDLWLVRERWIRPPLIELHRYDGSTWSTVDIDLYEYDGSAWSTYSGPLSGFSRFMRRNDEVWLATPGSISRMPGQDMLIPGVTWQYVPTLWFGPDALWATTPTQALRYVLP